MLGYFKKIYLSIRKYIFLSASIILLVLFGKILISNKELILSAIYALKDAEKIWIFIAIVIFSSTVVLNTIIYMLLSYKKLAFILTFKEQFAVLFVNKIFPSGLGQLTLNSYYLHKEGNSKSQTASVLTSRAICSGIGFSIILTFFIFINWSIIVSISRIFNYKNIFDGGVLFTLVAVISILLIGLIIFLRNKNIKQKLILMTNNYKTELLKYKDSPEKIIISIFLSFLISLFGIFTLWASAFSLNLDLIFREVIFIYFVSILIAGIIPVPGGIGTTEIGLYIGFFILGYDPEVFLSIILVYRFINYWLPLGVGFLFFLNLRNNVLNRFTLNYNQVKDDSIGLKV